ncbi:hypothetical protein [Aerolutibacter daejeonensis]|nr:hypothetical protein [Lysobacter daejeonensis]
MRLRDGVLELSDGGARQALYTAVRHVTVEGPGHPVPLALCGGDAMQHVLDVHLEALDVGADADAPTLRLVLMRWVSGASFDLHAGCLTLAP